MATSQTKPSTPRLSEVARHVVIPAGIVSTSWPRVVAKCRELGVEFDEWQHGIGQIALGKRADGKYAATVGGVVLSIPRQVGKTFLVGMIVIALCLLFPGLTVLWTAHRTRTATKTFHTLKGMTERPKVAPHMLDPRLSNGEQEVRFHNGSVIMFGAREQGFGRGFDEVDVEVFDEAQILSERALEDMVPATNQSRHEAGALLFFMGTPPRPSDPGEEFANRRKAALDGSSEDMVYVEFSADQDADPDDREQWRKANPSFPGRTPVESMKRMRANLTDDASYLREALGVWDPPETKGILSPAAWSACTDPLVDVRTLRDVVLAVDVAPGHVSASIVAAAFDSERGAPVLELVEHRPGASWLPDRLAALVAQYGGRAVLNSGGPVGSLVPELLALGLDYLDVKGTEYTKACGRLVAVVNDRGFRHRGEPEFMAAVEGLKARKVGDGFTWSRSSSAVDITPLVGSTLALWAVASAAPPADPVVIFV